MFAATLHAAAEQGAIDAATINRILAAVPDPIQVIETITVDLETAVGLHLTSLEELVEECTVPDRLIGINSIVDEGKITTVQQKTNYLLSILCVMRQRGWSEIAANMSELPPRLPPLVYDLRRQQKNHSLVLIFSQLWVILSGYPDHPFLQVRVTPDVEGLVLSKMNKLNAKKRPDPVAPNPKRRRVAVPSGVAVPSVDHL